MAGVLVTASVPSENRHFSRRVEAFAGQLRSHQGELAEAISRETGKPRWEALEDG